MIYAVHLFCYSALRKGGITGGGVVHPSQTV